MAILSCDDDSYEEKYISYYGPEGEANGLRYLRAEVNREIHQTDSIITYIKSVKLPAEDEEKALQLYRDFTTFLKCKVETNFPDSISDAYFLEEK